MQDDSTVDQAWIDVGGTFTDCYLVPSIGQRRRIKVLSTGLVPVSLQRTDSPRTFVAPETEQDPDGFWVGAQLNCFDASQKLIRAICVTGFRADSQELTTDEPLPGQAVQFELASGLEAPVLAVRRLLKCPLNKSLPKLRVRMGTTRGTNALLTRRGAKVALAITQSLEDLLLVGDQTRPNLFDLSIVRDESLAALTLPIIERLDANGQVLKELDEASTRHCLQQALAEGCDSLAICLLHSYRNPDHEMRVERIARDVGFEHISRSSSLAPLIEIVARARTTVVDAYLGPIVRSYMARLAEQFGGEKSVHLQVMTSAGGLVDWTNMAGKDSILSGPAGGVVALRAIASATGVSKLIGLDMGGTSTDTCRTAPDQGLEYESTKAGVRILTPTLPIETVASGGGSICWFDGVTLRVGPQSAGALPGPACYGRGGPLTITDLNVFLGRLPAEQFPFPLAVPFIQQRLTELNEQLSVVGKAFASLEQLADGLRVIAASQMAEAVRTISIAQGADPREHALVGFGGAAGQHICEIAELLGIDRIIHSQESGLLSALGMGLASERRDAVEPIYKLLKDIDLPLLEAETNCSMAVMLDDWKFPTRSGDDEYFIERNITAQMRYQGTDTALAIDWLRDCTKADLSSRFHLAHRARYGYAREGHEIELVAMRRSVTRPSHSRLSVEWAIDSQRRPLRPTRNHDLWIKGQHGNAAYVPVDELQLGISIEGPAVVLSPGSTLVIEPGWYASSAADGTLLLARSHSQSLTDDREVCTEDSSRSDTITRVSNSGEAIDPVSEAVFAQRLGAVATQMGLVLQQTALSVNVKQRRDFSCAVFDAKGRMLASAPHVPVHLGAMGSTVRAAIAEYPDLAPGDVVVTNNPYAGGSHLPDVTVISCIYAAGRTGPALYVANRAHHADIGGMAPGSMCVSATKLGDEGAIIPLMRMSTDQCAELEPMRSILKASPWPPRNIEENLADLRAQLAANTRGIQLLEELAQSFGWQRVDNLSQAVLQVAEARVRNFIARLPLAPKKFLDAMDDGTEIQVQTAPTTDGRLRIDFTGTGPVSRANFNANPSIVTAAIIYVLRCLIADDLPLNEGMLAAIDLNVPEGLLNPKPAHVLADSPAVAAGNVETSQRVVDCLLGAFEAAAASQGTMNNLLFGNQKFGFYETICGGAGATQVRDGASGVHTHMTNTRLTDPEILEAKYPARLLHFGLRQKSGGIGRHRGGDGVIRRIQFLEPVSLSLLTSRRGTHLPYGLRGGGPGAAGKNVRIDLLGKRHELPASCYLELQAGESIELQTPGGGGFGETP